MKAIASALSWLACFASNAVESRKEASLTVASVERPMPSVLPGGRAKATVELCSTLPELDALRRRLALDNDWLVPWQMTLAPMQVDRREAIIRLILPARILRNVKYGKRLDQITTSSELFHCVSPGDGSLKACAKETQPKYWVELLIQALERTGYITKKDDTYDITPKGRAWLGMTAKFSLPLSAGIRGTDLDWTWRLWFPKPSPHPVS